jgi:Uma2 family endonuclease
VSTTEQITTAEQLLRARGLGRCELVRGVLIRLPFGTFDHGCLVADIAVRLSDFARENSLGAVTGTGTGFQIAGDPDTVRAPDVGFVVSQRDPGELVKGYFQGAPDLAVEVLSPEDRAGEVLAKVRDWLGAACRRVWVVDPRTRTVSVHRSASEIVVLSESDTLTDEELLPGFRLPVAEIFTGQGGRK